jgi:hypothetical protein
MVDEHNVSLELLVGNSLNQADPGNTGFESRLYIYIYMCILYRNAVPEVVSQKDASRNGVPELFSWHWYN